MPTDLPSGSAPVLSQCNSALFLLAYLIHFCTQNVMCGMHPVHDPIREKSSSRQTVPAHVTIMLL